MISNGFQARLLNSDLISIEETFALTPASSLFEGRSPTTASSPAGEPAEYPRKATFPSISVDCYSTAYRPKALSVVRRGAVFVSPVSSNSSGTITPGIDEEAGKVKSPIAKEKKLYLAFRWAGPEHTNAECAGNLGDIAKAKLQQMRGIGLVQSELATITEEAKPSEEVQELSKESRRSFLLPWKKTSKEVKTISKKNISAPRSRKGKSVISAKDHPFLAQLYVDNKLIPLTSTASTEGDTGKQLSTVMLVGGALLDLGMLGLSLPDAAANEILHTVTLHLWDATRPDVHIGPPFNTGHQIRWGPKKSVVPNVIFHFEIVSSGPQEAARLRPSLPRSSTPIASSKPRRSALVEEFTPPLQSDGSPSKLDPVAEEDSYRSTDDASLIQASRHAKMRKAAAIAANVIKPRPRTSSSPRSKDSPLQDEEVVAALKTSEPAEDTAEASESTIKNLIRKVTFTRPDTAASRSVKQEEPTIQDVKGKTAQVGEDTAVKTALSVPRVKRVPVPESPSMDETPNQHHQSIPLIRVVSSSGSSRSAPRSSKDESSTISEAKRISLLGTTATRHDELMETIETIEGLKREQIQVENERKLLEEQWNRSLLKSMDEDVVMLQKRVEEGKREVDLLRKRVWPAMS